MPTLPIRKPQDLGSIIRLAREQQGLSQTELADHLAFSRDYMMTLESGDPNIWAQRLFRTLHELGIELTVNYEPPQRTKHHA